MNIYVVVSGRPAGEMYHREIGVVFAESEEEARSYIEIDNRM